MSLIVVAVSKYLLKMVNDGVRIRIIGDRQGVPERILAAWDDAEARTAHNSRITVSVAFNYGGRWDVLQACRQAMAAGLEPQDLDEAKLSQFMSQAYAPDPDLFIRTGGEIRVSNFLLWQIAYAELVFSDCLWPDFDAKALDEALAVYARRDRRFGQVKAP
jgi:undecaprenyl diphosphate synthase